MKFELDDEQKAKLAPWLVEAERAVAKAQGREDAYHGAIGGEITYSFSPTGLGVVCTVHYAGYGKINLTDYDSW